MPTPINIGTRDVPLKLAKNITEKALSSWESGEFIKKATPITQIELDDFKNIINHSPKFILCGSFGDASCHNKFLDILNYLYENNKTICLYTNGAINDYDFWYKTGKFFNKKDSFIEFGLDSFSGIDFYRKTDCDVVKQHILAAKDAGANINVKSISFSYNQDDIKKISEFGQENSFYYYSTESWMYNGLVVKSGETQRI